MKIGIKQISEATGFSTATVSNVLNNKKNANKQTSETILRVAKEMGYRTNVHIKTIKLVRYRKHGAVLGDTAFFGALTEGVNRGCQKHGYTLEMITIDHSEPERDNRIDDLTNDTSAAVILLATELEAEDMEPFIDSTAPVVVLDNWFSNMLFSATAINNADSVYNAVTKLMEKGHQKIGYLKSSVEINNFRQRCYGFTRAFTDKGLVHNPQFVVPLCPTTEGSYMDMARYLATEPKLPTAFFADNDIIALGALKAMEEKGIAVPEDVSLIGFDDIPYCKLSSPSLTTVHVFKEDMGECAVNMLHSLIKEPTDAKNKLEISTRFIERASVRSLK